jgi:hypothetical protein
MQLRTNNLRLILGYLKSPLIFFLCRHVLSSGQLLLKTFQELY